MTPLPPDRPAGAEVPTMEKFTTLDRRRGADADDQHRHRQDLPGDLPEDDQAHRPRQVAVRGDPLSPGRLGEPGFRAEPGGLSQGQDPGRRRQFRLRLDAASTRPGRCSISASAASSRRASPTSSTTTASRTASCRSRCRRTIVDELMDDAKKGANAVLTIDLESQTISRPDGENDAFRDRPVPQALPAERARRYRPDRAEGRRDRQLRSKNRGASPGCWRRRRRPRSGCPSARSSARSNGGRVACRDHCQTDSIMPRPQECSWSCRATASAPRSCAR